MLGRIMKAARAWIEEVQGLDDIGLKAPPDLQFVAKRVLDEIPDLKPE